MIEWIILARSQLAGFKLLADARFAQRSPEYPGRSWVPGFSNVLKAVLKAKTVTNNLPIALMIKA